MEVGTLSRGRTFKGMTDATLAWQTERFLELETHRHGITVFVRPAAVAGDHHRGGRNRMAEVRDNAEKSRYELLEDGRLLGVADYRPMGDRFAFPHTEIVPARRKQGLGAQLVRGALDDIRRKGGKVVPLCWFVAEFIEEHPEYADLRA